MPVDAIERSEHLVPDQVERERMRERPSGRPTMVQTWTDLVFVHFAVDPEIGQAQLPERLTIDTFPDSSGREMAWIGLVAFRLRNIRPPWGPALPWLSAFNEVNVRTYAHLDGGEPSVWFCSLDGAPWPVRTIAKLWYKVPYFQARVTAERHGPSYASRRPSGRRAKIEIVPEGVPSAAEPGSLEWFLFERYQLFTSSDGRIYSAKVAHAPYQIQPAEIIHCETNLCTSIGLSEPEWSCAHYCREVQAEFFAPRRRKLGT